MHLLPRPRLPPPAATPLPSTSQTFPTAAAPPPAPSFPLPTPPQGGLIPTDNGDINAWPSLDNASYATLPDPTYTVIAHDTLPLAKYNLSVDRRLKIIICHTCNNSIGPNTLYAHLKRHFRELEVLKAIGEPCLSNILELGAKLQD